MRCCRAQSSGQVATGLSHRIGLSDARMQMKEMKKRSLLHFSVFCPIPPTNYFVTKDEINVPIALSAFRDNNYFVPKKEEKKEE